MFSHRDVNTSLLSLQVLLSNEANEWQPERAAFTRVFHTQQNLTAARQQRLWNLPEPRLCEQRFTRFSWGRGKCAIVGLSRFKIPAQPPSVIRCSRLMMSAFLHSLPLLSPSTCHSDFDTMHSTPSLTLWVCPLITTSVGFTIQTCRLNIISACFINHNRMLTYSKGQ